MNYRNMTNENAASQYADDCSRTEAHDAYIERLVNADLADLREFGFTFTLSDNQRDKGFMELLEDADDDFHKNYMYENFDPCLISFESKERFYDKFLKLAFEVIEKHLYEKYREIM